MRPPAFPLLLLLLLLAACAPTPRPSPLFFYLRTGASLSLVLQQDPLSSAPLDTIPLPTPAGCSFWALTPAPAGPRATIEWQCAYGPAVQVVHTDTGQVDFLLADPTVDNRLLAWSPDGKIAYLKAGTLSSPQVLRVEVASRQATPLPLSPNTYNLTVSPDGRTILYALTAGIGQGSELWSADAAGAGMHRLLADAGNILGLMRYSPDGQKIAYIRLPDNQSSFPAGELWLADPDGKHARRVASADAGHGLPPVWSPDGTEIAFAGRDRPDDPASVNLSVYRLSTSHLLPSPFPPLPASLPPAWSPDGARLYFTRLSDGKMELWFYEIPGGKTEKLLDDACCGGWIVGR